jgi:hypothetical protein
MKRQPHATDTGASKTHGGLRSSRWRTTAERDDNTDLFSVLSAPRTGQTTASPRSRSGAEAVKSLCINDMGGLPRSDDRDRQQTAQQAFRRLASRMQNGCFRAK